VIRELIVHLIKREKISKTESGENSFRKFSNKRENSLLKKRPEQVSHLKPEQCQISLDMREIIGNQKVNTWLIILTKIIKTSLRFLFQVSFQESSMLLLDRKDSNKKTNEILQT